MQKKILVRLSCCTLALFCSLSFIACGGAEEEEETLDKSGGVDVTLSTEHLDNEHDALITTTTVYAKGTAVRTISHRDTMPSLGMTTQEAEDDDGNTTAATMRKDYEVFVTLK
jgi:hypothetical protein